MNNSVRSLEKSDWISWLRRLDYMDTRPRDTLNRDWNVLGFHKAKEPKNKEWVYASGFGSHLITLSEELKPTFASGDGIIVIDWMGKTSVKTVFSLCFIFLVDTGFLKNIFQRITGSKILSRTPNMWTKTLKSLNKFLDPNTKKVKEHYVSPILFYGSYWNCHLSLWL